MQLNRKQQSYLLNDEKPKISALVLKKRNEVVEEGVQLVVAIAKGNDDCEFGLGLAVARPPPSSLRHAASVSSLDGRLRDRRHVDVER